MIDIINEIDAWRKAKKNFAVATILKTWRSAPRQAGSAMAISDQMEMIGSVSGGCIEGEVVKQAQEVIASGIGKQLTFGVSDETAWSVGLSCGGGIEIWLEPAKALDPIWETFKKALGENSGAVLINPLDGSPKSIWTKGDPTAAAWQFAASEAYLKRRNSIIEIDEKSAFVSTFPTKDQLVIIGAAHVSIDLVDLAQQFGFECTVIDPRGIFSKEDRFRKVPKVLTDEWPQEVLPTLQLDGDCYAVLLTHDPKIDDPAAHIFMKSDVAYLGALGSRKTHAKRVARLEADGFSEEDIAKISAPIGLPIGSHTPKEIALSVIAEIIKVRNSRGE